MLCLFFFFSLKWIYVSAIGQGEERTKRLHDAAGSDPTCSPQPTALPSRAGTHAQGCSGSLALRHAEARGNHEKVVKPTVHPQKKFLPD